jgi:putative peptidoglycan lipid II flippase
VASFNYAQKIVELPMGILITTIGTVALTKLSALYGEGREAEADTRFYSDLQLVLLLACAVVLFGIPYAPTLVDVVFHRGAMTDEAIHRIAFLANIALCGVPFLAVANLATVRLNAHFRAPLVLRITATSLILLPLLALPGILMRSDGMLMGAVVGFQAILMLRLARAAEIRFGHSVFRPAMIKATAVLIGFGGVFALAGFLLPEMHALLRLAIGGTGFAVSMLISWRCIR